METLQETLATERERARTAKIEAERKESNLSEEKTQIENEYAEVSSTLSMRLEDISRLENINKIKESELKLKDQELLEYKQRAAKVLQLRDKQIEELKKMSTGDHHSNNVTSNTDHDAELLAALDREDLTMSLERIKGENQELVATIELMKRQAEAETNSSRFKIRNMEKSIEKEKQNVAKAQQTIASLRLNVDETRHRFDLERKQLNDEIRKKTLEIKSLSNQIAKAEQNVNNNTGELEMRARVMAESLIEKQSQLETLNSEKAALVLELEKAKQRIREVELISRITPLAPAKKKRTAYDDDEDDDVLLADSTVTVKRHRFFRDLSNRGFLARKFASSVGVVDRMSIVMGRYLKRLPLVRVLFVVYILVLHIWVLFVMSHNVHQDSLHHADSHAHSLTSSE